VEENPYFDVGENIRGHEFHYTYLLAPEAEALDFAFKIHRGHGFGSQRDGLKKGNVLASYTHIHALGTTDWAPALIRAVHRFRASHSRSGV
jgi:cobyrinic acid a,c-diamide synthase